MNWTFVVQVSFEALIDQVIPGNDQNTVPTNQAATGSKLDRTSQLTFYGSPGHLKSFLGDCLV